MADPPRQRKVRDALARVLTLPESVRGAALLFALLAALAYWTRQPSFARLVVPALLLVGAATGAALLWRRRGTWPGRSLIAAWGVLLAATFIAGLTTWHLRRVSTAWHEIVAERVETAGTRLSDLMRERVGDAADAAAAAASAAAALPEDLLFARLEEIREQYDVDAVAALDSVGDLVAWAGDHRGPLPERVRAPAPPPGGFYYVQRPLYTYLYAIDSPQRRSAGAGTRGVVALLLEDAVPSGEARGSIAETFERRAGLRPRFGAGGSAAALWELSPGGVEVAHATFTTLTQTAHRDQAAREGLLLIVPLLLITLVLLWPAWEGAVSGRWRRLAPLLAVLLMLALLPLGSILGIQRPFSPGLFLLPGPGDWTLGRIFLLLVPLTAWVAAAGAGRRIRADATTVRQRRLQLVLDVVPAALVMPLLLVVFRSSAGPSLFGDERLLWFLYQPTVVLAIALSLLLLLPAPQRARDDDSPLRLRTLAIGLALAALLGFALDVLDPTAPAGGTARAWFTVFWAVPFAICAHALRTYHGSASRLLRVFVATWIAATAALPQLRADALAARLAALEREVAALGVRVDPYLEFLVRRFATEIAERDAAGDRGVSLVYRAWAASGLAEEAYSPRITVWGPDGVPEVELTPGTATGEAPRLLLPPEYLQPAMRQAAETGEPVFQSPGEPLDIQQLGAVPLADERVATVVVPMRRALSRSSVLEPLLPERRENDALLTLRPTPHDAGQPSYGILWLRAQQGWLGEADVDFSDAVYHAHVEVRTPPPFVRFARGVLLLALDLMLVLLLWAAGRIARLDPPAPVMGWRAWFGSYRARVTGALFAFFLVPTLAFGTVAYRGLAGEVTRAARLVAERSVRRAVDAFGSDQIRGDLTTLSEDIDADVLYYHRGELLQASTPEALDLGLYSAWMPEWVYRTLRDADELGLIDDSRLGDREFIVAYRSLPASGTLAVPVWPAAGMAATRQTELAHLILFAALAGGLLSLALSVAVGRALAGPIARLRHAAGAVGGGNLRVRLPERRPDEFGQLYQSFNRMIERLRQARSQEVRTARVLAWGEMARQVAHEIKNPLTPIRLSVQHMQRAYDDERPDFEQILDSNVEQILKEIDRLSEIARVFARYGAPAEAAGPLERVRLAPLLTDVARLYASGESEVTFHAFLEPGLPDVSARGDELKEVMINLLENAREALDGRGTINLSARVAGDHVDIAVEDDGPGIPAELLPRIFEPRFSSRSSGTGLGLAIVRRLVDSWGGALSVDTTPGRGTTMVVSVPAVPADADYASAAGS